MTRRALLLAAKCEQPHCPVDVEKLNRFAAEFNDYVGKLQQGQLDLKQWPRVVAAWEHLR